MNPATRTFLRTVAAAVAISVLATGLALGAYERLVREARTPRFATVDLTRVVQAGKARYEAAVIRSNATEEDRRAAIEAAAGFNDRMRAALEALASDCRCTLIGLPAVFGEQPAIPDYTGLVIERMDL